ncbi:MAG TPA: hypothetical protein VGX70_03840 [Gemmataceae bacterium]|jgi:hypothetical protein|nr:hypothetical protein [Gemmataceae bacterium]
MTLHDKVSLTQKKRDRSWSALKDYLHARLVRVIDLRRAATITDPQLLQREVRLVVERLVDTENPLLNRMERERLIDEILDDTFGFGPLGMLFHNDRVREIRVDGSQQIMVRKKESFEPAETAFRGVEQVYLVCARLLSAAQGKEVEPIPGSSVELEAPPGFQMKADFPTTRLQSPILHFRRLREPAPEPTIPAPNLPPREQRIFVRFVKALHDAGHDELSRVDGSTARRIAEQVVDEALAKEKETISADERAKIIQAALIEALARNSH